MQNSTSGFPSNLHSSHRRTNSYVIKKKVNHLSDERSDESEVETDRQKEVDYNFIISKTTIDSLHPSLDRDHLNMIAYDEVNGGWSSSNWPSRMGDLPNTGQHARIVSFSDKINARTFHTDSPPSRKRQRSHNVTVKFQETVNYALKKSWSGPLAKKSKDNNGSDVDDHREFKLKGILKASCIHESIECLTNIENSFYEDEKNFEGDDESEIMASMDSGFGSTEIKTAVTAEESNDGIRKWKKRVKPWSKINARNIDKKGVNDPLASVIRRFSGLSTKP